MCVSGTGISEAEPGHDGGFVTKESALIGYGPDVDVLLYGIPSDGGILRCCLEEESVVFQALY